MFEIQHIHFLNDCKAQLFYLGKEQLNLGGKDSNIVLGAFVTCYGRLKLYEESSLIDDRVLNDDTDDNIFK